MDDDFYGFESLALFFRVRPATAYGLAAASSASITHYPLPIAHCPLPITLIS